MDDKQYLLERGIFVCEQETASEEELWTHVKQIFKDYDDIIAVIATVDKTNVALLRNSCYQQEVTEILLPNVRKAMRDTIKERRNEMAQRNTIGVPTM